MTKYWTTDPTEEIPIRMSATGFGSTTPVTVIDLFKTTLSKHANEPAMGLKRAATMDGPVPETWKMWTWQDYYNDCMKFAQALISLNVDKYKIITILGFNSPEWLLSSTGAQLAGCIATGIYATNTAEACHYISEHSKSEILVLENNKQLAKYAGVKLSCLKAIVMWEEKIDPEIAAKCSAPVYQWEDFLELGKGVSKETVVARGNEIRPGNCAALIYTSGTTGPPKAVMISHDNVTWTTKNICEHYMNLSHKDRVVSYLPLSHIAAQLIDIYCMLNLGACTYFCQPDALKGTLTITMKDVRPTFFFAVPRVWEKISEKMIQMGRATTGIKKSISTWAKGCGMEHSKRAQFGAAGGKPFGYGCANAIVLSKIKEALGLDQTQGCFTAAAPISPDVLWYFAQLDIPIYEVFGQSECTGPHTVSDQGKWKIGTCGRPIRGSTTKLVEGSGEICYTGRHIFMGYMHMEEKTKETIDEEGFLHSGDVAVLDEDNDPEIPAPSGFMTITGRIKELIITAGGENVPPVLIENEMKLNMPAISNVMVIGDKRKFLAMVLSLKVEVDLETGIPKDELAKDSLFVCSTIGSTATTYSQAKNDPLWKKYIDDGMKAANKKTTSNAQIVQKWIWLPVDFSEKEGDLTPTLKLKRSVVNDKYIGIIDAMYA